MMIVIGEFPIEKKFYQLIADRSKKYVSKNYVWSDEEGIACSAQAFRRARSAFQRLAN